MNTERVAVTPDDLPRIEAMAGLYRRVLPGVLLHNAAALLGWMLWDTVRLTPRPEGPSPAPMLVGTGVLLVVIVGGMAVSWWAGRLAETLGRGAENWRLLMFPPGLNLLGLMRLRSLATAWCHARRLQMGPLGPTKESLYELWLWTVWRPSGLRERAPKPPQGLWWGGHLWNPGQSFGVRAYVQECRDTGWDDESIVQALIAAKWPEEEARRVVGAAR